MLTVETKEDNRMKEKAMETEDATLTTTMLSETVPAVVLVERARTPPLQGGNTTSATAPTTPVLFPGELLASLDALNHPALGISSSGTQEEEQMESVTEIKVVKGLTHEQGSILIRSCVGLLSVPIEPDTLHAVMRCCLRLTRLHEHATTFAELCGPKLLLGLTQASAFTGFQSLATLLIRHILEEPETLKNTMEKVH